MIVHVETEYYLEFEDLVDTYADEWEVYQSVGGTDEEAFVDKLFQEYGVEVVSDMQPEVAYITRL
jgi:hypothetical protein